MPLEKCVWEVLDTNFIPVTPETPLKEACTILTGSSRKKSENPRIGCYEGFRGISGSDND
jgi:hypothetical protein